MVAFGNPATVQDARRVTAVERPLGPSPERATLAVVGAQVLSTPPDGGYYGSEGGKPLNEPIVGMAGG